MKLWFQKKNLTDQIIADFGNEWARFKNQDGRLTQDLSKQFASYTAPLPENTINSNATVADFGAGSGRWSNFMAPLVQSLFVVEPSSKAMEVAKVKLHAHKNVSYLNKSISDSGIGHNSLDLGICLGVLHHTVDPLNELKSIHQSIKPGGYFLGYLYYSFENKPKAYRFIWQLSRILRVLVSHLPTQFKVLTADLLAFFIYFPLAKVAQGVAYLGIQNKNFPLHQYADVKYRIMRNDALDRFGTRLEKRFSMSEIQRLVSNAGFDESTLVFSDHEPFWTFSVRKHSQFS